MNDFAEAGPSNDIHDELLATQAIPHLTAGRSLLDQAARNQPHDAGAGASPNAEQLAREALLHLARYLDWVEDTLDEAAAHVEMDLAGRWVRETFGCRLSFVDGTYAITCPVDLAHTRMGFSIGGTATRICSLCGKDLSACPHDLHIAYMVPGGLEDLGWCRVCLKREACQHLASLSHRANVVSIITDMDLEEISIVAKPAHPEARITRTTLPTKDLRDALGADFVPGIEVSCDKCLNPCQGLRRPFVDL